MPLKAWVPSLNRASQLHLLLESCERNASGLFQFYISYDYTNDLYREAYHRLMKSDLGKKHLWQARYVYGSDFYDFLDSNRGESFTHFVDDCIFYRPSDVKEEDIRCILDDLEIWGFNWRVGLDTKVNNHRERRLVQYPHSLHFSDLIVNWDYTEYTDMWSSYWAFPYSLDGFTYRVDDMLDYLSHVDISSFKDPAEVEHHLCRSPKRESIERPWMSAPRYSNVFSNHLNSVHSRGYNPANQFSYSYETLNKQYLDGYKIDMDSIPYERIQCGHEQLPFTFIRMEA